jgi:magnesium chelatase family protein
MSTNEIRNYCKINNETRELASTSMSALGLSARAYSRILKVARTIADLEGSQNIETHHFSEAVQYRPRVEPKTISNDRRERELAKV